MKFGVVIFPGSNCDEDIVHALRDILGQEVEKIWHKDHSLNGCDFIVLPGGFSFGDYLRSGAIARFSPIMEVVQQHAAAGGYVLGICNGFQILAEAGLVPGALLRNEGRLFICDNYYIKPEHNLSPITAGLDTATAYKIPIAHAEGRYYADEATLNELEANGQVLFRYCDMNADFTEGSNPNGSAGNIAAVCNRAGNVMGMMPHPERAASPLLNNTNGYALLSSLVKYAGEHAAV
ncbi:MAG: phosphoribosylformylglycinamidine synthase subunit PurQ [Bacteroidota bacterium]